MPGVTSDGKPKESYGYDIGGKTVPIKSDAKSISTTNDELPPSGTVGRLDKLNVDRFVEKKDSGDGPAKTYSTMGYEGKGFDKDGNVKGGPKSEPKFLESDGSWAPAEGRGGVGKITKQNTNAIIKK